MFILCTSRLVTEGCLISVCRGGAGSGGRDGSVGDAAQMSHPAVQAAFFPACLPHAEAPLTADKAGGWSDRSPAVPRPGSQTVDVVAVTPNRQTRTERIDHRGSARSKPTNTARGTPLDLADLRHYQDFDKP